MRFEKKEYWRLGKKDFRSFILAGDIGGTNTNLGIFGIRKGLPVLLVSFHFKSHGIKGLEEAANESLGYAEKNYGIKPSKACFAVAGVLSHDKSFVKLTNAKWNVSVKSLAEKTNLKKIMLINDFEAIGYSISMLGKNDLKAVKKARKIEKAPVLIIGAGTGLGKAALFYDANSKSYIPITSEAGHSDFAAQDKSELALAEFIKKSRKIKQGISYEEILSGRGLINIYLFLRKNKKKETKCTKEITNSKNKAELISQYRKSDSTCKAVFGIFTKIYARFARNFALDAVARGGVYIAGGIIAKNSGMLGKEFVKEFENNYMLGHLLKEIPVYAILNYNAGLLGAGFAGARLLK